MQEKKGLLVILPFFAILILFMGLGFWDVDSIYSIEEARYLTQNPLMDIYHPNYITKKLNDYVVDQFPGRSIFLKVYTYLELVQNKKDVRNAYIIKDQWLMGKNYTNNFSSLINSMHISAEKHSDIDFYYAILPVKNYCLFHIDSIVSDEASEENLRNIKSALDGKDMLHTIDVATYMREGFSDDVRETQWFKTDFHWNATGAYAATEYILEQMYSSKTISQPLNEALLEYLEVSALYQGDLNRRFSNIFSMEERIPVISAKNANKFEYYFSIDNSNPTERSTIIASDIGKDIVDYNGVYTNNIGYYRITNQEAQENKTLVIFKDSLQNPTTDIFCTVFSEVMVIDTRYDQVAVYSEVIEKADVVLFMLHQNNSATETQHYILKANE